jgi:carbon-monoxide dehydrogenase medium subunit
MISNFDFFEPRTVPDLLFLTDHYKNSARIIAGGTNLLVDMKQGSLSPSVLISVREIADLIGISFDPAGGLRMGAVVTAREIETSPLLRKNYPLLSEAASRLGSYQVRNQATIGGNLCNASPAGDMIPPLMALSAMLELESKTGKRYVQVEDFFKGPGETILNPGEILSSITLPPPNFNRCAFLKLGRRESADLAMVNVALCLRMGGDNKCDDVRISLGAVAPTVIRALPAEEVLKANGLSEQSIRAAGEAAAKATNPISDLRASADYRREMARVLTIRALKVALQG